MLPDLTRSLALRAALAASLAFATGCAAGTPTPSTPGQAASAGADKNPRLEVPAVVVSPYSDVELEARFERGRSLLLAEKYKEAAEIFDQLVRLAPAGEVGPPSLYNSAVAREGLGERAAAVTRLEELLTSSPNHAVTRGALFRLERLYGYLERWEDLVKIADRILALPDLSVLEAIEGHAARGLGLIEQDRLDEASKSVNRARDLVEQHRLGEAGKPPIEVAMVSFALGEVRKRKSEKITFVPLPPNFPEVLEQRCQALLDAQSAYTDAMRSFDAHWSAMAGYRVGQLYQQLHRDVMAIPPSSKADTLKKKQLYEGAMRLRYRILLEKGLKLMDATVRIGDRTGEDSMWVGRAKEARRELELALEDEKKALAALPYSEAELQEALDQLRGKAASVSKP